ncbi:MAG: TonB-dependent receptor [Pigmentiphaga sp.]|nr:TonB-dependent receptor [Pigmentiphaga sp.]
MKKILIVIVLILSAGFSALVAQNIASGIIKDETGEPLIGVTVTEKDNHANGTITDVNGKFSLNLKKSSTVIISYIGYKTTELLASTNMIVALEPEAINIEEVVVVGYGTQRKETVIGAVTTVKGEQLEAAVSSNLSNSLAGRVSGVTTLMGSGRPGINESTIFIRGISTLSSGNTNPLILVDGVERDMGAVDAEDIESFTVLKDAAATAVYGIRGANGVILITTRRGQEGKARISATVQQSFSELIRLPTRLNSYKFATLRNEALINDGMPLEYSMSDLQKYKDHSAPYTHPDNDYAADFLRTFAPKIQANVNITGGTDKITYFISGNMLNEQGILKDYSKVSDLERFDTFRNLPEDLKRTFRDVPYDPNPSYERFNLRTNVDIKVSKSTNLSLDLTSRIEKVRNIGIANSNKQEFFTRFFRTAPNLFPYITPNGKFGAQGGDNQSPLVYLTSAGYQLDNNNTIEGTIRLSQKLDFLLKGLSVDGQLSFDNLVSSGMRLNHRPEIGRYTRNGEYTVINTETDWSTGAIGKSITRQLITQLALRYNHDFNKQHHVGGLLLTKQRQYYANALLPQLDLDYVGRITYDYKRKYMTEVNMAYNGSSNFNKEKRFGFFPSFSLGWAVSEENFWKDNIGLIDFFKIRGSVGEVGNDKLGNMQYFYQNSYGNGATYNFGDATTAANATGYLETQLGNPYVTWERALKSNIGVDLQFFNKIKIAADYFLENRYDILTKRNTISQTWGVNYALPAENIGVVRNQGVELEVNYNEKLGAVDFWINANMMYAKNKILYMDEIPYPDELYYKRQTGLSVGSRFGYVVEGFYQSWEEINDPSTPINLLGNVQPGDLKFADRNGDGLIDDEDIGYIDYGKIPELSGGLTIGASYKGFSLSMMWQGSTFSTMRIGTSLLKEFEFSADGLKGIHEKRWAYYTNPLTDELVDTRDIATYHRLTTDNNHFNHATSTANALSSEYLRLKNVEFSYSLQQNLLQKLKLSRLTVFVRGNNVLLFDHLADFGVDPEAEDNSNSFYPQHRVLTVGTTINF